MAWFGIFCQRLDPDHAEDYEIWMTAPADEALRQLGPRFGLLGWTRPLRVALRPRPAPMSDLLADRLSQINGIVAIVVCDAGHQGLDVVARRSERLDDDLTTLSHFGVEPARDDRLSAIIPSMETGLTCVRSSPCCKVG